MGAKALKTSDAYSWMLECQKLTEKHGGFSSDNMRPMRGYQSFSIVARKLGYMSYYEGKFHWISDSVTMVMAELILHEHHIRNEEYAKARAAAKRELDLNKEDSGKVIHPVSIGTERLNRPDKPAKSRRWWNWLFDEPEPDPFERFLNEVFRNGENPFALLNQKVDMVTENQKALEDKLIALNKALAAFLDEPEDQT